MGTCRLPLLCLDIVEESVVGEIAKDRVLVHVLKKIH